MRITISIETDEADLTVHRSPLVRRADEGELFVLNRELDDAVVAVKRFYGIEDL